MQQSFLAIIAVISGLGFLAWSTNRFIEGASGLARGFNVSPMIIGLTIVAFGTSAPEMLISAIAALQGNSGIGIGTAIGSNITNMALVVGVTALITPLTVHSQTLSREFPVMLLVMLVALIMIWDNVLSRFDGLLLLSGMVILIFWTIYLSHRAPAGDPLEAEFNTRLSNVVSTSSAWWELISGLILLLVCSRLIVWGATSIAYTFGISDLVVGLTIIAVGSSLPELAASVTAACKGEDDIAIGSIVGSNLFNILAALGITSAIDPGKFDTLVLTRDYPLMLGLSVIFYYMARGFGKSEYGTIQRWEGGLLFFVFISYQIWIFITTV